MVNEIKPGMTNTPPSIEATPESCGTQMKASDLKTEKACDASMDVSLSADLTQIKDAIEQGLSIDSEKINALKQQIELGHYEPNSTLIAKKLLEDL